MRLVIGDRATLVREFDVAEIAVETAKNWFRQNLPEIDPNRHLVYQVELKGGSEELTSIFHETATVAPANDTSAAVGYAPLSETEQLVITSPNFVGCSTGRSERAWLLSEFFPRNMRRRLPSIRPIGPNK